MSESLKTGRATLSVVIITKNEEGNIHDCLESVRWANETVVVDACSTDRTVELARTYTSQVFVRPWTGYGSQKNFAMDHATKDWVLIVDADERVSYELRNEILDMLGEGRAEVGYRIPRRNFCYGRWIRGAGQYPDMQLRLIRRGRGRYNHLPLHEHLEVDGPVGDLQGHLEHHSLPTVLSHARKINRYSILAAQERLRAGKPSAAWYHLLVNPLWTFIKVYLFRGGYRDRVHGFLMSGFSAAHVLLKYIRLWEQEHAMPSSKRTAESSLPPLKNEGL